MALDNVTRYEVRNTLFRLKTGRIDERKRERANEIWDCIYSQLKPDESLENFTFAWDVYPEEPLKVIRRGEWDDIKKEKYPLEHKMQAKVEEETTLFTGQKL